MLVATKWREFMKQNPNALKERDIDVAVGQECAPMVEGIQSPELVSEICSN